MSSVRTSPTAGVSIDDPNQVLDACVRQHVSGDAGRVIGTAVGGDRDPRASDRFCTDCGLEAVDHGSETSGDGFGLVVGRDRHQDACVTGSARGRRGAWRRRRRSVGGRRYGLRPAWTRGCRCDRARAGDPRDRTRPFCAQSIGGGQRGQDAALLLGRRMVAVIQRRQVVRGRQRGDDRQCCGTDWSVGVRPGEPALAGAAQQVEGELGVAVADKMRPAELRELTDDLGLGSGSTEPGVVRGMAPVHGDQFSRAGRTAGRSSPASGAATRRRGSRRPRSARSDLACREDRREAGPAACVPGR